jgi:Zn-dependent protease with chaperone function
VKVFIGTTMLFVIAIAPIAAAGSAPGQEAIEAAAPGAEASGPVPVPEPSGKAMRYYRSGNALWVVNALWGFALPAILLFTGFSARMRDWARVAGRRWFFTIAIYVAIFSVVTFILEFPLAYYQGFVRPHAYDLSTQSFGKWLGDSLKGLVLSVGFGALFLWIPYLFLKKSPGRWWLYTGLVAVPVLIFTILVSPIWVAPLFNDFGPMKDKALEAKILNLAHRAGIEGGSVYEVDMSVDTKQVGAYVTGVLNTKRIVLYDNIIEKMSDDELLFVVGHESGHYVLGHVFRWLMVLSAVIIGALWLAHRMSEGILRRFGKRFRFARLSDVASLPLILLMFHLFFLLVTPAVFTFGRHVEHEADRFGLEITRNNPAAATAFVKLQHENLGNPRPGLLYKLWRASHPTLGDRIDFANTYRPWETGEPLVYADRFKD